MRACGSLPSSAQSTPLLISRLSVLTELLNYSPTSHFGEVQSCKNVLQPSQPAVALHCLPEVWLPRGDHPSLVASSGFLSDTALLIPADPTVSLCGHQPATSPKLSTVKNCWLHGKGQTFR